jgi:NitT/TauT family transport system substrate-binding protein
MGVVSKEFVLQVYKVSPRYCASISDEFIDSTLKFVPVLKELDYIAQTLTKEDIFDLQFIERVHPEAPHY